MKQNMNKKGRIGKAIVVFALVCIVLFAIAFAGQALSLWSFSFWEPKWQDAKRDVWEQTSSRINGATQDIAKAQLEYSRAESDAERNAICAYLRNSYPDVTPDEIDDYRLSNFYSKCKYGE